VSQWDLTESDGNPERIKREHAEDVDDDVIYMKTEPTIYRKGQTSPNRAYSLRPLTHRFANIAVTPLLWPISVATVAGSLCLLTSAINQIFQSSLLASISMTENHYLFPPTHSKSVIHYQPINLALILCYSCLLWLTNVLVCNLVTVVVASFRRKPMLVIVQGAIC
jgi:hypothetical protein